jgi:hypothetical protein
MKFLESSKFNAMPHLSEAKMLFSSRLEIQVFLGTLIFSYFLGSNGTSRVLSE